MFMIALLSLFLVNIENANGQTKELEIKFERKSNNSVDFYFTKSSIASYTVYLEFKNLNNSFYSQKPIVVSGRTGKLLTLNPTERDKRISFSFKYTYIAGHLNPEVNREIIYLLPFVDGVEFEVYETNEIKNTFFGSEEPKNWKSYYFLTNKADTVVSTRKGIVTSINDQNEEAEGNFIIIEHKDGTLARYKGFDRSKILVQIGDMVNPNDQIGVLDTEGELHFNVSFLAETNIKDRLKESFLTRKSLYEYITPIFFVNGKENELISGEKSMANSKEEYIQQEWSKREIKKFKKK